MTPFATASSTAVVVLGFHRSGTSMTTRLLNLLGVDLGPEGALMEAVEGDNPRGYWEPKGLIELNDEILAVLGGTDIDPPALEPGWERTAALAPLRDRARQLLEDAFGDSSLWGFKDPRTCLTLPFWQELLADRVARVSYVLCVRSPSDTASSMLARPYYDGFDHTRFGRVWLEYTGRALAATAGDDRILVFYDDLLADSSAELARLAAFLGVEGPAADVAWAIEPGLRHHASSPLDTVADDRLPLPVRAAYLSLRAARDAARAGGTPELPDALEVAAWEHWFTTAVAVGEPEPEAGSRLRGGMREEPAASLAERAGSVLAEARRIGDDWREHGYYAEVERYMDDAWAQNIWPVIGGCDFTSVVDLAAGHGRNTRKLLDVAAHVTVADINEENIEACRRRFGADPRVSYLVCDGVSLAGLGDGSQTLVYCYDAMVHFDSDSVRSYLRDFRRALAPGGHAFCHHSNFTGNPGGDVHANPQWRNFMSKELFAHYAIKEGLEVVHQRVIDWSQDRRLDCLTLLRRP